MRRLSFLLLLAVVVGDRNSSLSGQAKLPALHQGEWLAAPSDGVTLNISRDGTAMRLDFDFHGGSGYAIARRNLKFELPADYEFTFRIRGETPPNTLEFKLVDETGDNVWWVNNRNYRFPREWTRMRIKKRHLGFAWGPGGREKPLKTLSALEIVITASTGGKGSVWIDELRLDEREPPAPEVAPVRTNPSPNVTELDLGGRREIGGLTLDWGKQFATDYVVELSEDRQQWYSAYTVARGNGGADPIYMPDTDARFLRIRSEKPFELREVRVEPLAFSTTRNTFFTEVAARARGGLFPKYFGGEQSYWTVFGIPGSEREGLINEEGAIEVDRSGLSIEPFLWTDSKLMTWRDVSRVQSLAGGHLPIPSVEWKGGSIRLVTTAIAIPGEKTLYAQYEVTNRANARKNVSLFLALRPFQVNPPWQFLNVPGGVAEVREISLSAGVVRADEKVIVPMTRPSAFGAAAFDSGDIVEYLERGVLPADARVNDTFGAASAALRYDFALEAGATKTVLLALPEDGGGEAILPVLTGTDKIVCPPLECARRGWTEILSRFSLDLPPVAADVARAVRSNVAYILINQDGPAIQPGSRSYDRSWIRDGSLTSSALLRLGYIEEARSFIEWFAKYQFASGKVPCCVDTRGADPVPEHDSSGEFIFAVADVYGHTGDKQFLQRMWPHVDSAVTWIELLIAQRSTEEYRAPGKRAYFGLVPESISHEGYSAKAMHSYWDDFFTLKGLKDAVEIARALNKDRTRYETLRDDFRRNLVASIDASMRMHNISYIPGSVELGDFDATSTTIAITPGGELENLPRTAVNATFERYFTEFTRRRDSGIEWEGYTPYETRAIGTFVRLGQRERAHELLSFFMRDQRPAAWNHWAEVVFRDPKTPKFIGDMPHTWVGSDFIRSVLDMLAYETEDGRLIIGAGIPLPWISGSGVSARGMRTHFGALDMRAYGSAQQVTFDLSGSARPPRGVILKPPRGSSIRSATADGVTVPVKDGEIRLEKMPGRVVVKY